MLASLATSKIRPDHLARQALISIRQSTMMQVRTHTGSTTRQYDLVARARDLGWPQAHIRVIDQDQGASGATAQGRDGFQDLVADVGRKRAGAVFCLEASRLARSCSDWYYLLEICALTDTLVIDDEGIDDPGQYNDRLLLGCMGTMSEAELHWLRQRLLGGKLAKAQQGQLRMRLPVGLVYDPTGRVVLDPDDEVREAVRLVFELFTPHGSALAVVTHFTTHRLRFPTRLWGGSREGELVWPRLSHARVFAMLHNPRYAGTSVYGRTTTRTQVLPGEAPRLKGRTRHVKREAWPIVLLDAHPGSISWARFQCYQQQLDDNRTWRPDERRGAVRDGTARRQGLVRCGRCGRRMSVRYPRNRRTPTYECNQAHTHHAARTCQALHGDGIDAAVTQQFLEAIQPAHLEVSLATLDQLEARARQVERQWQLRLERAQYEADAARRRFCAVEPANRLVARSLEHDWHEKLAEVERLGREAATRPQPVLGGIGPEQRARIVALAQDLPAVWAAPTTTNTERKQLLRCLIKDVTLTKRQTTFHLAIRWQTEAWTTLELARPARPCNARRTAPAIIARIRALAPTHTDRQIAALLNQDGAIPAQGAQFSASKVKRLRYAYAIATSCPEGPEACATGPRGDGRSAARAAAELLQVDVGTIADWCAAGKLDYVQSAPHSPRWITLTPATIAALRKPVRQRKPRCGSQA